MDKVAGIIYIATKYQADDICTHFVKLFQKAWPTDFEQWDTRVKDMKRIWTKPESALFTCPEQEEFIEDFLPDPGG